MIINSSMTTLSAFANLDMVATNGQLATFMTKNYEIVVSGLLGGSYDLPVVILNVGNTRLTNIGNLLMIQDSNDLGTYVANNVHL